jgi:hypothetical protein
MVGINKQENGIIQIYPNPTSNEIRILANLHGMINVSIINLQGQLIQRKDNSHAGDELDISQLDPGVYFVRLIAGNKRYLTKFVKK